MASRPTRARDNHAQRHVGGRAASAAPDDGDGAHEPELAAYNAAAMGARSSQTPPRAADLANGSRGGYASGPH